MTHIDLPRALEVYFAFAEIDPTRAGRRFTISLPYFDGARLDRLQWWYHLSREQEERGGEALLETLRTQAIERFRKHIDRWLHNTGQCLSGAGPIPSIKPIDVAAAAPAASAVAHWPADRVANG
jgi:hypothetical protein